MTINTEREHERALLRIAHIENAIPGTPEFAELSTLADAVYAYEEEHWTEEYEGDDDGANISFSEVARRAVGIFTRLSGIMVSDDEAWEMKKALDDYERPGIRRGATASGNSSRRKLPPTRTLTGRSTN